MSYWHIHHGRWWMVQWQFDWWFSTPSLHIDPRTRIHAKCGMPYGPYIDFHCGMFIFSIGRNCYLATDGTVGRGGVS